MSSPTALVRPEQMTCVEIDNSSFDLLKLNAQRTREFSDLMARTAEVLELTVRPLQGMT